MKNKNTMIIGIVVAALVGVGVFFALGRSDKDDTSKDNSSSQQAKSDSLTFSPKATENMAFMAEFTSTGTSESDNLAGTIKNDGNGTIHFSTTTTDSGVVEMYMLADGSTISCQAGACFKTPATTNTGVSRSDFVISQDDITKYQSTAKYEGVADCPAGKCDVWTYVQEDSTSVKVFIGKDTNMISKVEGSDETSTFSMTFTYENVTITLPENVQEIPTE